MKKKLIKTGTVTFLCLSFNVWSHDATPQVSKLLESTLFFAQENSGLFENRYIVQLYGLQNTTNLNAYHCGLKTLNPRYKVPTELDLLNEIRLHPFFSGLFEKELSGSFIKKILRQTKKPFFIYETNHEGKNHFYLAHANGVRHFTVNGTNKNRCQTSWIENGHIEFYPFMKNFIACTFS